MKLAESITHVPIGDLHPLDSNPRLLTDEGRERLTNSLDKFGLYKPLVAWRDPDTDRLTILAGNQRAEILREQGVESVPVVLFEGTPQQARAVALRDNNEDGEWQWDDLSRYLSTLSDLADDDHDWTLTGFDADTVDDLLALAIPQDDVGFDGIPDVHTPDPATDPTSEPDDSPSLPTDYVESRFVNATIGNLRGKIPLDVYSRFTRAWSTAAEEQGTTDVTELLDHLVERWGG